MKRLVLILAWIAPLYMCAQSDAVRIESFPKSLVSGQELQFSIFTPNAIQVEVAVFADTFLGYIANAEWNAGKHDYAVSTEAWPAGKYYILLKNESLHLQEDFIITLK